METRSRELEFTCYNYVWIQFHPNAPSNRSGRLYICSVQKTRKKRTYWQRILEIKPGGVHPIDTSISSGGMGIIIEKHRFSTNCSALLVRHIVIHSVCTLSLHMHVCRMFLVHIIIQTIANQRYVNARRVDSMHAPMFH